MNLYLNFILLNSDYSQSIADDFHNGDESEDNVKHLWEDELKVSEPVKDFKIIHNQPYVLAGLYPDDTKFEFEIPRVTTVTYETESGERATFAVSKKLIKSLNKVVDEEANETHLTFYLDENIDMENPFTGVYIDKRDFPKALKVGNERK